MKDNENNNNQEIDSDKIYSEQNSEDYLDIGNLNINQEVDIKENPNKHIVNTKKKNLLKYANDCPDNKKKENQKE